MSSPALPIAPWWAICKRALCGKIIIAGPFFTEADAAQELFENPRKYGNCRVEVFSGVTSKKYVSLYQALNGETQKK